MAIQSGKPQWRIQRIEGGSPDGISAPRLGKRRIQRPGFGLQATHASKKQSPTDAIVNNGPWLSSNGHTQGVVIIEVPIDKNGNPLSMLTVQDVPGLTDLARAAVGSWKFMPAMESGKPVVGMLIVAISFVRPVVVIHRLIQVCRVKDYSPVCR